MKQAVRVTNPSQYSEVVSWLTCKGFKPFMMQIFFISGFCLTLDDRYLNMKPEDLEGYEVIEFEDFKNRELCNEK